MQTFFFDTEINGALTIDDEGVYLPDIRTAKREALAALYGLARELEMEADALHAIFLVRDASRRVVLSLDMNLTVSSPLAMIG